MYRADPVKAGESLRLANELARIGVEFVCIPVHGSFSREVLSALLTQQLAAIEKEINDDGMIQAEILKRHGKYKQMKCYLINGKKFKADAPVNWDDAIAHGGFYFERAKHFKLPLPPACFVANSVASDIKDITDEEYEIIDAYNRLLDETEIYDASKYMEKNY